jgi:hypothetical protein
MEDLKKEEKGIISGRWTCLLVGGGGGMENGDLPKLIHSPRIKTKSDNINKF